ncbi:MAG: AMP-binding protein [Rhodospirillaceae bacterium]|nr:AMP-binding protein [Rhodospirillaceae bacterium]MBT7137721.1 AMP-binding protein [Rhodospirillaceae bacterium]
MLAFFYEKMYSVFSTSKRDAFVSYDTHFSYDEMFQNMLKINSVLTQFHNHRLVVYANKEFPTYCALFATILSGNTWVPMNPSLPAKRVMEMMSLAEPSVILTDRDLPDIMTEYVATKGITVYRLQEVLDGDDKAEFDLDRIEPNNDAIIYFTSGSTGMPKGVPLTHANYCNTVNNLLDLLPFNKGEVFADYHDFGFVISIPILFPCVMTESAFSPALNDMDLLMPGNHLGENKVTVLITVPSTIANLRRLRPDGLPDVKLNILINCGEPLHLDILDYCLNKLDASQINNFYGSTEVSCWTFRHLCKEEDLKRFEQFGVIPIGNVLPGTQMQVTKDEELMVSGRQITAGYLNDVNPESFVMENSTYWFRTGDKVVPFQDMWICKGRLDSQVKISGYRIELTDTEAHLRAMKDVDAAVCFVSGEDATRFIVAILHSTENVDVRQVRTFLADRLPSYMFPKQIICKAEMPLNKAGKIDRAGLKAAYFDGSLSRDIATPE